MKALAIALALMFIAAPVHAASQFVPMVADPSNANWCAKPTRWKLEFNPGVVRMWTRTEIEETHDIPVAADGSFNKTIEMLSSNSFSFQLHVWGNVNTREFHAHNVRRFCKYHGSW